LSAETNVKEEDFQTGSVATISFAHAIHDTYTGSLPPLLPILIEKFTLTNTAAGLLSVFVQIPSLIQPWIGYLVDHHNLKWMVIMAPAITGVAMSLLGIVSSYRSLALFLLIAGLSSAALHAVGPALGSNHSGTRLGKGMSFWMVAGEMGRALGPVVVVTAIGFLGLEGMPWLMVGGMIASVFLYIKLRSLTSSSHDIRTHKAHWKNALDSIKKVLVPVSILVFSRSFVTSALSTYLPTYLTNQGATLLLAGASLTILEIAGMAGALLAGPLSDRFGRQLMLLISYIATPIFMILFIYANDLWRIPLLILLGFFAISITPVIMAIVMENAADNRFFANGIYMVISFVLQALTILLVGLVSDWLNLRLTFLISAFFLTLGLPAIFLLPKSMR
jgi:FSR family fosmidomycin resistance protein-like MFS transporter